MTTLFRGYEEGVKTYIPICELSGEYLCGIIIDGVITIEIKTEAELISLKDVGMMPAETIGKIESTIKKEVVNG